MTSERRPIGQPAYASTVRHNANAFRVAVANMHQPTFDWLAGTHALMAEGWGPALGLKVIDEAGPVAPAMWGEEKQTAAVVLLEPRRGRSTMGHQPGLLAATDPVAKREP